jgi:ergot alkaloid biosynthesis protein
MNDRILVTGGTGKTGRRVVDVLREEGALAVPAARSVPNGGVAFDWAERKSWSAALDGTRAIYLVAPPGDWSAETLMIEFVESALERGVRRFVLLSGSPIEAGGPVTGKVHAWLQASDAEWAVLRPSWFMENLSEGVHRHTIREERAIYTATGGGRAAFISTRDIARAAARALTSEQAPNSDYVLTGSEALSYDDVARHVSAAMGVPVSHHAVTFDQLVARHVATGMDEARAQALAIIDLVIAEGTEDRVTDSLEKMTKRAPVSIDEFARDNVAAWS